MTGFLSCYFSLGHHHLDKLLVVDLPVSVDVGLADHLVDLLVGKLLTEVGHDVSQLRGRDKSEENTMKNAKQKIIIWGNNAEGNKYCGSPFLICLISIIG